MYSTVTTDHCTADFKAAKRVHLKCSHHHHDHRKDDNDVRWRMCSLTLLWWALCNIQVCQIITLYTLNLYNITCQSYFNKAGKKTNIHPTICSFFNDFLVVSEFTHLSINWIHPASSTHLSIYLRFKLVLIKLILKDAEATTERLAAWDHTSTSIFKHPSEASSIMPGGPPQNVPLSPQSNTSSFQPRDTGSKTQHPSL